MFKNVLIISDNVPLCKTLQSIIQSKSFPASNFTFSTSPFSNADSFAKELETGVLILDLKKRTDVQSILAQFDLVISIHCKQIFPTELVNGTKCINIHPGYNPINRGWYPQVFAILNDLPAGATIHEIDEELDHGAIIARAFVDKTNFDTSLSLYNKILQKEIELFEKHIASITANTYETVSPENEGNIFFKKDFNDLLELDLSETASIDDLLKKLRALSHGNFKNAYYIDPETQQKVFVSLNLDVED